MGQTAQERALRITLLTAACLLVALPALAQPACRAAQIQMDLASDESLKAVNQVMVQSNRFRAILQHSGDEQKSQMRDFCRQNPFAAYDAARSAFDKGATSAHEVHELCSAADQQARADKALSRYTNMQANNDRMILRLRGACAAPG
jgi:hypothetical protein